MDTFHDARSNAKRPSSRIKRSVDEGSSAASRTSAKKTKTDGKSLTPEPKIGFSDPRIWKTLAASRFLTTPQLGRLLLFTNRSIKEAACGGHGKQKGTDADNDALWKTLCVNHWGSETAAKLLRTMDTTAKSCFQTLAYPPKNRQTPPALQFSPQDYGLIVDVRSTQGKLLFCEVVDGKDIPEFFQKGKCDVNLGRDVDFLLLDTPFNSLEDLHNEKLPMTVEWKSTVHLVRRPDRKVIELVKFDRQDSIIHPDSDWKFNEEDTPEGALGSEPDFSSFDSTINGVNNKCMDLLGISLIDCNGTECEVDLKYRAILGPEKASVGIYGFHLYVSVLNDSLNYPIHEDLEEKGLQFSHFLEALREWDDAPAQPLSLNSFTS